MHALTGLILFAAVTFNQEEWLGKREMMSREAERLEKVYDWCAAHLSNPAEKVRVPVDTHPDGSIKTIVLADKAQMFIKESYVWAEGVTIGETDGKKRPVGGVKAEKCAVDRNTRSGWIEGPAEATRDGMVLTGENAYLSSLEEYVTIFSKAVMTAPMRALRKNGDTNGIVRISSDRADFDRKDGIICLDGSVRFDDGDYKLAANRAFAFLEGTNEVRKIEVIGSVAVTNGLRSARCNRAEYDCLTGQLMMYESNFEVETSARNSILPR